LRARLSDNGGLQICKRIASIFVWGVAIEAADRMTLP